MSTRLSTGFGMRAYRLTFLILCLLALASSASGQDWSSDEDDWGPREPNNRPPPRQLERSEYGDQAASEYNDLIPGWSFRGGVGLTSDPQTLLLNFELPYAFDRWVSAGPMLQVGIDTHDLIVAPTAAITVGIPDMPGRALDRLRPYALVGIGFAVIEDDNRPNDNISAGFLINCGVGLEFKVSQHLYLGSQMMFNFLPEETLDEDFFYSWQVGGIRLAF